MYCIHVYKYMCKGCIENGKVLLSLSLSLQNFDEGYVWHSWLYFFLPDHDAYMYAHKKYMLNNTMTCSYSWVRRYDVNPNKFFHINIHSKTLSLSLSLVNCSERAKAYILYECSIYMYGWEWVWVSHNPLDFLLGCDREERGGGGESHLSWIFIVWRRLWKDIINSL